MKTDIIISLIFWLLDKIPGGLSFIYKRFSPVKVNPSKLTFRNSEWSKQISVSIENRSPSNLFDIHLLLPIDRVPFSDIDINIDETQIEIDTYVMNSLSVSYSLIQINFECDSENYILLKLHELKAKNILSLKIKGKNDLETKFKITNFDTLENPILTQKNRLAVSFEVPAELPCKKATLVQAKILMKKTAN